MDENELSQVVSRREGSVGDSWPSGTNAIGTSQHHEISPWLFDGNEASKPPNRPRANTGSERGNYAPSSSMGSVAPSSLKPSQSIASFRPNTPPSASTSTSTLAGLRETPPASHHGKKSKNPFHFLKKKSTSVLKDNQSGHSNHETLSSSASSVRPQTAKQIPQPLRPAAWLDSSRSSHLTSPSSASLRPTHASSIPPAFSVNPWISTLATRQDSMPQAFSVEEEQDYDLRAAEAMRKERKKMRGVLPHIGREREKSRNHDDPDGGREGSNGNTQLQATGLDVELSLDTNFDQIDDIVDTSIARNRQMGGSMNDGTLASSPSAYLDSANSSDTALVRTPSSSYSSLADQRQASLSSTLASSQQSSESGMRGSVRSSRFSALPSPPGSQAGFSADGRPLQININRPGLRRISLAEAQQHQQLRRVSTSMRDIGEGVSPTSSSPNLPRRGSAGAAEAAKDVNGGGQSGNSISLADVRKGSITSAHSTRSHHSGISPKTSYADLPAAFHDRSRPAGGWTPGSDNINGRGEPNYHFPPTDPSSAAALAMRKSSASSAGQAASSSWMAPDSWAVQPDQARDYLRDDNVDGEGDDDDDDQDAGTSVVRDRRGSSSGLSAVTNPGMYRSGSSDPYYKAASTGGSRRGTEESIDPKSIVSARHPSTQDSTNSGSVEILETAHPIPSPQLSQVQQSSSGRPSSRGGSLAAAGAHAAAAAAGKLGLHRPSKHRSTPRPNTAGSIGAARSPQASLAPVPTVTEDDTAISNLTKRESGAIRRPGTGGGTPTGKNHFIRIYKTDDSFATLSCSVVSTASEVRTILARKSLTNDSGAFRLFVRDKGSERPLGSSDKPAQLQRRRLIQAGYTEADGLEDLGRDDLSYLLRFVFRPDSVPNFDSESFGNSEHTFQHLDLQGRNLEMVPIFLYRHADWIVSLDLSGNPMSDLPLDFIQLCSSLRTLRLSNLALKRIPQSIKHSETLTHLEVSNNRIFELGHIGLDSIPELKSIKVQNNRLFDLPPYFADMSTLRYLNISNNRFEQFPEVICQVTSLVDLDISFNAITALPAEISKLVNLERFILAGNSVEELPESMSALVSLRTIDLRRNAVQDVSPLLGLPKLQVVQAENNNIKAFEATLGSQLRTIELRHNPLSKVKIAAFTTCDLTALDLSSTNMTRLEEDLFPQLAALSHLTLDRNQFIVLPETLGELQRLEVLSCNNNLLSTLPESIGKLKRLKKLYVHNNNLKTMPTTLWDCESLESINVSSNLLESFPSPVVRRGSEPALNEARKTSASSATTTAKTAMAEAVAHAAEVAPLSRSLKKLRLGDNRLGDDVFSVLSFLSALEVLNLSFNEIFEIPNCGLSKHVHLRELYVSGNDLSSIPADDLEYLQELRILHLNGNKLQTLPAELGRMGNLANLDVGNNMLKYNIANWHYDWNWISNPELRYLNLSGNKRLEIKSKLTDVGGRRTNMADFNILKNLRLLGLMDVTMPLQSNATPDESDNRRVRTSLSQINNMAYGIADALGKHDNLSIIDLVVPRFRKDDNECLFGLFEGRGHDSYVGSRIARYLAEWIEYRISWEEKQLGARPEEPDDVTNVMRRAFLRLQKDYADVLINDGSRKMSEAHAVAAASDSPSTAPAIAAASNKRDWRAGASAVLAYVVNKTLYIANAGDSLAVLSRNGGTAHLISTKHEPFDRQETERIRSAEGWVSLRGFVNDSLDVSRSFGYFHLFPIVNAAPAVTTVHLTDSDEFVVLANRTLWQYVSYQTAVDIARTERNDPMIAAQKLRDFAISYGAEESIMVMVISVGDLFYSRQQRNGSSLTSFNPIAEANKKANRRMREELPGDRTLARLDREVAPPIGHVALVFTDIKNSTSLWETNGGMQAAMRMHNYLLRRQLRTIGGYEVKTEGDAFMVSFPSVTSALLWCFTVQVQLLQEDWPQEILESEDGKEVFDSNGELIYRGLSVRMGIHWGFPVCEADPITRRMDYFGPMVNRAARICGAADGGQIMASRDVITELQTLLGTFEEKENINANGANGDGSGSPVAEKTGEERDDDEFRLLNPNVSRDVVLLRRMGFGISSIGERRLKGLETPEVLSLVYPKQLAGRLEETKTDAPEAQVYEPTMQLLDIEEVKQIGMLCLRLEALSNHSVFPGILPSKGSGSDGRGLEQDANGESAALVPLSHNARRKAVEAALVERPELLIYAIRDDATDEELAGILEQLTTRIQNTVSTLAVDLVREQASDGLNASSLELLLRLLGSSASDTVAAPSSYH